MMRYEKPTASVVDFEIVDVVAISFDELITWGGNVKNIDYGNIDFYD